MENSNQKNTQPLMVMKTIRKKLALIGISPKLMKQTYPFDWKLLIAFLEMITGVCFIGMYISVNAESLIDTTQSFFIGAAGCFVFCTLLILLLKVKKLFAFFDSQDIIANRTLKYTAMRSIYCETDQLVEKLSEIVYFLMVDVTPGCVFVPWISYIFFIYFSTDLGNAAFELPCPMWFPFDWKNPIGFLGAMTLQCSMLFYGLRIGASALILASGSYLYEITSSKIIKATLFAVNQNAKSKSDQASLLEQIIEFLRIHSNAQQMINNFSDIFQHIVLSLFVASLIVMSGSMLIIQIQLRHHSGNLLMLLVTIIETVYAFGVMFISCELGQRMSLTFDECSQMVDQFEWYLFPAGIQRMLPIILSFQQQPFEIKCFGSAACDRETFKAVIKTAFSYFTVLRQFYN